MKHDRTIRVWAWDDAPQRYKNLSEAGGNEDWVAVVPIALFRKRSWIPWMEAGTPFGCCNVRSYSPKWLKHHFVRIGQHA